MKRSVERMGTGLVGDAVARTMLWVVLGLVVIELLIESVVNALGLGALRYTFLWVPDDRFDDYFKFVLSFPVDGAVHASSVLGDQVAIAMSAANPYRTGVSELAHATYSHFHTPPLVALFCLGNAALMRIVDPGFLFLSVLVALAAYWLFIAWNVGQTRYQRIAFGLAGLLAYPMMLMAARGNVYAGATGLLILHATLLAIRGQRPTLAAVLMALAINIRPNAIVLLPLLPLLYHQHRLRVFFVGAVAAAGVFVAMLTAAHALYADYTLASFKAGLAVYYRAYVIGDLGPAFSSSFFGPVKVLFGYRPGLDLWAALPGFAICGVAMLLAWKRRIEPVVLIFLLNAGYCLASTLFCDYHLMPFAAVPLALAADGKPPTAGERYAMIASCLMLAPKCYLFSSTAISAQLFFNPLILLVASGRILALALLDGRSVRRSDIAALRLEAA